jgi:hypothetical protein
MLVTCTVQAENPIHHIPRQSSVGRQQIDATISIFLPHRLAIKLDLTNALNPSGDNFVIGS